MATYNKRTQVYAAIESSTVTENQNAQRKKTSLKRTLIGLISSLILLGMYTVSTTLDT